MLLGKYKKIVYADLDGNTKAQESYNYQKASAVLADYGFFTNLLKYDWLGADFLAQHINGDWIKVQLKGRLTLDPKYFGKEISIMFEDKTIGCWYLYPHDELHEYVQKVRPNTNMARKGFDTGEIKKWQREWLQDYRIN